MVHWASGRQDLPPTPPPLHAYKYILCHIVQWVNSVHSTARGVRLEVLHWVDCTSGCDAYTPHFHTSTLCHILQWDSVHNTARETRSATCAHYGVTSVCSTLVFARRQALSKPYPLSKGMHCDSVCKGQLVLIWGLGTVSAE